MNGWTNEEAIRRWSSFPRQALDSMEPDGDFGRRNLLNPVLLRMLGAIRGQSREGPRVHDHARGHGSTADHQRRRPPGHRGTARRTSTTTPFLALPAHLAEADVLLEFK